MASVFDVVFFDCDSTLSSIEGIDELAAHAGMGPEMEALTNDAMEGRVPLEQVYGRRLEAIKPSRTAIRELADTYITTMVPGTREVFKELLGLGKDVHVVSGGLRPALLPLALELGLSEDRVHAVDVMHAGEAYRGFEADSPLARAGGKAEVCASLLKGRRGVIIGDGMTDSEAVPPCELFVGFGGVVARPKVQERAGAWVPGPSLTGVLAHLLSSEEKRKLSDG